MSIIRLAFLGTPQLQRNQQALDFHIAKVQALLAYLAVTRTAQSREHLLGLLWAESHAAAARKNLRNRLWQLRQILGDEAIVTTGDTLALGAAVWSDVEAFVRGVQQQLQRDAPDAETLDSLLHLWRGPLLDGLVLSEAPEFELWLTAERVHLGQLYLQALMQLLTLKRADGDWQAVIDLAQRGLLHDPLHEPLHQQLMMAYAKLGARTDALRQYEHLHTLLAQELGVPPLLETDALRSTIIKNELGLPPIQEPFFAVTPPAIVVSHATNRNSQPSTPTHPFIGRQAQLATLDLALQQASRGQCKVVLISGELGMGKTRLWQTWAATLALGPVVLETRCLNTTQALPFDPVRRLLSGALCRTHFAQVAAALLPVWCTELLHLAPSLQQGVALSEGRHPHAGAATPAEERGLVAEALTQFLYTFMAKPLIFFLDDLHWADGATLDWLLYLTDRMATEPLLLVGAYRPEDAPVALTRLVGQWQREGLLQRMPLPSLTKAETIALLAALESNVVLAEDLHQQSGGNPYYLTQLRDVTTAGIPASLADLVKARLHDLAEPLQPIVQAAAVLEPAIDVAILGQTSGRSEDETVDALDGLLAAGVLVERAGVYEFAHPLVASVVRDSLSNGRRKLLHRRAAEGIAIRYAEQLPTVAGQLARHYAEAGASTESARFAEMAGDEALRIGAATEAVAFYQQAYTLAPTPTRRLGVGRALYLLPGKLTEARTAMQAALDAFSAQRDCRGAIRASLYLAGSYLATGEGAQVLHWAQQILPDLETVEDPTFHASAHYLMGTAKFRNGYSMQEAAAHYAQATRLATEYKLESEIALMSWFEWGNLHLEAGDYAGAVAKFQQAQRVAQAGASIHFEALSLNNLAYATLLTGAVDAAKALIERGMVLVETYALLPAQQYFYSTRGEIALAAGELTEATTCFHQALILAQKYDNPTFAANVRAHLGRVAQARGALEEAYGLLIAAKAGVAGNSALYLQSQIDLWLAALHLQRGDPAAADASLRLADARLLAGQNRALQMQARQLRTQLQSQFQLCLQ